MRAASCPPGSTASRWPRPSLAPCSVSRRERVHLALGVPEVLDRDRAQGIDPFGAQIGVHALLHVGGEMRDAVRSDQLAATLRADAELEHEADLFHPALHRRSARRIRGAEGDADLPDVRIRGIIRCITCIALEPAMLALRLPEDLEDRLDALAKKTGRTKSFYAREAIVEYIDDLEDLYLAQMRHALRERGKTVT